MATMNWSYSDFVQELARQLKYADAEESVRRTLHAMLPELRQSALIDAKLKAFGHPGSRAPEGQD
jgi:gentisate 1,2-dioxygenase